MSLLLLLMMTPLRMVSQMDVFAEYKPIRNKISQLAVEEALATIWAYTQHLQIDGFQFPREIEVPKKYLQMDAPRQWLSEWEFELLAKETILNGRNVASKNRALRDWKTLSEIFNSIKDLENRIYGAFGSPDNILVEMARIAHRQFIWQGNPPNSAAIVRYYKIFNRPEIDALCKSKFGLSIWEIYMCGTACMGYFLSRPAVALPFRVEIKALSVEAVEKFMAFAARPLNELKSKLKSEQAYNANFAYAYNSLRAYPLVQMTYQGRDAVVCPIMTLLYWRFTSGLYYEFIGVPEFGNAFGDGFNSYVGEVIDRACSSTMLCLPEEAYLVGKAEKRSVDWIACDGNAALFIESKARRLSWEAKASLDDLAPLEKDIDNLAAAVVQVYRTIEDYLQNRYQHFPLQKDINIFPVVVTLENWRMFGPVMMTKLDEAIHFRLESSGISTGVVERMPYSVFAVEDLEVALQIAANEGVSSFMNGKLRDEEMREWEWHSYMTRQYRKYFPVKKLFAREYDEMFANLYKAQAR